MTPRTVLITGGTGYVGRFIAEGFLQTGWQVVVAGRRKPPRDAFSKPVAFVPFDLTREAIDAVEFSGIDVLVHAAFDHVPGRFRGGEGDDPDRFRSLNGGGTCHLFDRAKDGGVEQVVFLSSRAVYGTQPAGALLTEATDIHPDTLYGEVKAQGEHHLAKLSGDSFHGTSLRVTGVYGPGGKYGEHKWRSLVADFISGTTPAPRLGTEVHGDDVAAAILLLLDRGPWEAVYNVSDLLVDRNDLLSDIQTFTQCKTRLPERADAHALNAMVCDRLLDLGWMPGGLPKLQSDLRALVETL